MSVAKADCYDGNESILADIKLSLDEKMRRIY